MAVNTLFLSGRIDSNNAPEVEKSLLASAEQIPDAEIVLDAENLKYISSAGLRVLMKLRKRANKAVPIVNVSQDVYNIMEVTGFTELFDVKKKLREVSVEGFEFIGSGGYGKVYRLDTETIMKIYNPEITLAFVERERNVSQKAFLLGVPTAISYDVVKCGKSYGVVYEMLNARTTAQIINENPDRIPEISGRSAELLKTLHKIVPGADAELPNRKQELLKWLDSISELITESEAEKVRGFISSIPDRDTFLHGDYNSKNIMVRDGEFQLIDIGDAAVGHPVFDIVGLMLAYVILPSSPNSRFTDDERRGLLGFDFAYAPRVWEVMCGTYFGLSSSSEVEAMTKKLMPYCTLMMTYQGVTIQGKNSEGVRMVINRVLRERLLPAIDIAEPLNF